MKTLKARISHPKKKTIKISDLTYNQHYTKYNVPLDQGVDKINDIMEHSGGFGQLLAISYDHLDDMQGWRDSKTCLAQEIMPNIKTP